MAFSGSVFTLCDVSTGIQRPYVPPSFRRAIFHFLHSMSPYPGIRATQRLVTSRFVWPGINADVGDGLVPVDGVNVPKFIVSFLRHSRRTF